MKRKIAIEIISFLFILLFVYAGLSKLMDYQKFVVQIGQSPLLTDLAQYIAWFIPAVEIIVSCMLAIPRLRAGGLLGSFTLMCMFTGYIILILQFSDHVPCSCGGVLDKLGWTQHLIFNIFFLGLAVTGIILHSKDRIPIHAIAQGGVK